ncbi:hypothetical protein LC724_03575 [Blautia sp. RD014234]|nr:hypothetical protein [Blautia parvula]
MERKEFAPLSFWAWNEFMDDESICRRIEEFHEEGLRGFFMHSRAGLMTSYLSKEWFHACRTAVKKAEELGMEAWIYDEDGWPSGFAGGLVNGCGQEYQAKYIKICKADDETAGHRILASFRKLPTAMILQSRQRRMCCLFVSQNRIMWIYCLKSYGKIPGSDTRTL